jgi:hypothetical protein
MRKTLERGSAIGRWGSIGGRVFGYAVIVIDSAVVNRCVWDGIGNEIGKSK